jgi:hypothetical protein
MIVLAHDIKLGQLFPLFFIVMPAITSQPSYTEFAQYCARFDFECPIGEGLYNKLIKIFDLDDVYAFACDVYADAVDDCTISLLIGMDDCGQVPYQTACKYAAIYNLENRYIESYGFIGEWQDPDGELTSGIDVGELLVWVRAQNRLP